jgi:alpha-amylase
VDFYANGFESMINFGFKYDAQKPYDSLFAKYDTVLHGGVLEGLNVLNYLSSHDDGSPLRPGTETAAGVGYQAAACPGRRPGVLRRRNGPAAGGEGRNG